MNTRTTLTTLAATTIALTLHTAAGATTGTCTLTAQPQDERSYHLAYTDRDGDMLILINRQDGTPLKPTSWQIPADFDTVLWATKTGRIDGPDSFYDHLVNAGGCQFTEPYHAAAGWRASIVIAPGTPAPTTVPSSTSTSAQPTPIAPTTTAPTDTTLPSVPVTRVTELPPATFPPTWPEQPGTTLPDKLDEVRLTPDPTPYTLVPRLPETGVNSGDLAIKGAWLAGVGVVLGVFSWLRRRNVTARTNQPERTFDAS